MGEMTLPLRLHARQLRVDNSAIKRYADLTLDYNPIHLDPEFAASTAMGGVIAHGMLSLSLIWQALCATLGPRHMAGIELAIRFVRPVREGDLCTAGGNRIDGSPRYDVWVRAEAEGRAETVISGVVNVGSSSKYNNER